MQKVYKIYKDNTLLAINDTLAGALSIYDALLVPATEADLALYSIIDETGKVRLLGTRQTWTDWRVNLPDELQELDSAVKSMRALKGAE